MGQCIILGSRAFKLATQSLASANVGGCLTVLAKIEVAPEIKNLAPCAKDREG
jgi:hypothetical protein